MADEETLPEGEESETRPLLKHKGRARSFEAGKGNATMMKAALLLLKSFVGTGVLFLPKAYSGFDCPPKFLGSKMVGCYFPRYFYLLSRYFLFTALCYLSTPANVLSAHTVILEDSYLERRCAGPS
jgi:hypothetical protein